MKKTLNTEEWIEKAKKIHDDKYDYSKVEYKGSRYKVCIICPEHGEFWQEANSHLKGCGCNKCAKNKHKYNNINTFIQEAILIHGNKYDYNKVTFNSKTDKITIICPIHGEYTTTPYIHLIGCECPKCAKRYSYDTEEWIEKARKIHGDKYDYSKVEYKNNRTKVCIICPEHGEFYMTPNCHFLGQGCPICSLINRGLRARSNSEHFIEKARKIHGNRYDYSKVVYKKLDEPVCIICPKHGEFWQTPHSHYAGNGCQRCNMSKLEYEVMKELNEINIKYVHQANKKTIVWLGNLRLDFYLPEYNVAIECQGEQHFSPVDFGGKGKEYSEYEYEKLKKRDEIKKQLCEEHNVRLLYYTKRKIKGMYYNIKKLIKCIVD